MALKPYRSTAHWKKIRLIVLRRDAYTCAYCGDVANEVDHIIAKVKGGEDVLDNLVAACRSCNLRKRDKDAVFLARSSTPLPFRTLSPRFGQVRTNLDKSDILQSRLIQTHPSMCQTTRGLTENGQAQGQYASKIK